ncbi:hypothetical protein FOMG_19848 [Fusarium oxysporum f. sp. melonis 26406]|uniref:Uncharacterized protein n=1 Tax=Fusarium oxysporum f. sp. melonis 26406 TaxID=1089452 RepID=W9Z404_FUSOX|nr:hypothetical protein FOMG_19848 [Fusarium oxysporum f. sp. melonis 26406]
MLSAVSENIALTTGYGNRRGRSSAAALEAVVARSGGVSVWATLSGLLARCGSLMVISIGRQATSRSSFW